MSTLKVSALQHPSSAVENFKLASDGTVEVYDGSAWVGAAGPFGKVVQVAYGEVAAFSSTGSTVFKVTGSDVAITPTKIGNYFLVLPTGDLSNDGGYISWAYLYEKVGAGSDTSVGATYQVFAGSSVSNNRGAVATRWFKRTISSLDTHTYSIYCSPYFTSFTVTYGGAAAAPSPGSSLVVLEIEA